MIKKSIRLKGCPEIAVIPFKGSLHIFQLCQIPGFISNLWPPPVISDSRFYVQPCDIVC